MRYLVTGGAGFIGSNLAFTLAEERKAQVVVLDNFSSGNFKNLLNFKGDVIADDILGREWWDKTGKIDAVFHEAAITDTTVHDQKRMMEVNVEGFRNILRFALERGIKRVVYASSAGVYGNGACPMTEEQPLTAENVYGFSKAMMDNVAREFAEAHKDMALVGLRYFNVYGPREYYKGHAASMMYQLYLQMKAGKRPRIFKYGEQMRDFVYVKDIVRANLNALTAEKSCVVNAATGTPENFNRVIECLNKAMGTNIAPEYFDNPYGFFQVKTHADLARANAVLNYKPEWTLEAGIADYVKIMEKLGK